MRGAMVTILLTAVLTSGCTTTFEQRTSEFVGDLDQEGSLVNVTVYNDAGRDVTLRLLFDEQEILQRMFAGGSDHGDLHESAAVFTWNGTPVRVQVVDLTHDHEATQVVHLPPETHLALVVFESRVEIEVSHDGFAWA